MLNAYGKRVTGRTSCLMDFIFLPSWLPGRPTEDTAIQRDFDDFIAALFLLVGLDAATCGSPAYIRHIGYHKLTEEKTPEGYS